MKSVHVEPSFRKEIFVKFGKKNIDEDSEIKNGDHVKISKYRNIFAIGYTLNQSEKVFVNRNIKNNCLGCMSLMILMVKKMLKRFMKTETKKETNKNLELKKVIEKKDNKQNVKWKDGDDSCNSQNEKNYSDTK